MSVMPSKKLELFKIFSTTIVPIVVLVIIGVAVDQSYKIFQQSRADSMGVPEYNINYTVAISGVETYQNINKDKYGNVDQIEAAEGELLIRLKDRIPTYEIATIASKYNMEVLEKYRENKPSYRLRFSYLKTPDQLQLDASLDRSQISEPIGIQEIAPNEVFDKTLEQIWQELDADPRVYCVGLNSMSYPDYWPNDPDANYDSKSELFKIDAPKAWQKLIDSNLPPGGSDDVWIAVIDGGVDLDHPDLADNIAKNADGSIAGKSFVFCDPDLYDCDWVNQGGESGGDGIDNYPEDNLPADSGVGHGTRVAGVAAEVGDNNYSLTGLAFDAKIVSFVVGGLNGDGLHNKVAIVKSLEYVKEINQIKVINISSGSADYFQDFQDVVTDIWNKGKVIVAAAGNQGTPDIPHYPAAYDNVIAVTALDDDGSIAEYANSGDWVDISTYGDSLTTDYDDIESFHSGTSYAVPLVSGSVALLFSLYPTLTAEEATDITIQRAHTMYESTGEKKYGCGKLNVGDMLVSKAPIIKSPDCITRFRLGENIELEWGPFPVGPPPESYRLTWGLENGEFIAPPPDSGIDVGGDMISYTLTSNEMEAYLDGTWTWRVGAWYPEDGANGKMYWTSAQTIKKHTGAAIIFPIEPYLGYIYPGFVFNWESIDNANNYFGKLICPGGSAFIPKNDTIPSYMVTQDDYDILQTISQGGICRLSIVGTHLGSWFLGSEPELFIPKYGPHLSFLVP
ncbi:S8 family serine peptidase [Patescibacteria group bacterium]|nr:S8 family serine peptidase [Patescibacteria group bacterium]